jgi:hypothetical protein
MAESMHSEPGHLFILSAAHDKSERADSCSSDLWQQVEDHFLAESRSPLLLFTLVRRISSRCRRSHEDIFLRLYRHLRSGSAVEALRPWLFSAARNLPARPP